MPTAERNVIKRAPIGKFDQFPSDLLERYSTLDSSQIGALKSALTSEFTLIQGPPGTGKSYVGIKIVLALLANCKHQLDESDRQFAGLHNEDGINADDDAFVDRDPLDADEDILRRLRRLNRPRPGVFRKPFIGPICCITYTNHALDQFSEGLLDAGIKGIVRIGGRCKNEKLEPFLLKNLSMRLATGSQRYRLAMIHKEIEKLSKHLDFITETMASVRLNWQSAKEIVEVTSPSLYSALSGGPDEDGFFLATNNRKGTFDSWMSGWCPQRPQPPRPLNSLLNQHDPFSLSRAERDVLCDFWKGELHDSLFESFDRVRQELEKEHNQLKLVRQETDLKVLRSAQVIAMTTSGFCSLQSLINSVGIKVIIVEEAAEVMEAHVLACLGNNVQQVILIGDHRQLRPKTQVHALSVESRCGYNLNLSLFERLVLSETVPLHTLSTQRRMRPEIAQLIRQTIYPKLCDSEVVTKYPQVKGMANNVMFLNHDFLEDQAQSDNESTSHSNAYEIEMVVELAAYLLRQGYSPGQITVLTPYVGQLLAIRSALSQKVMVFVDERDQEEIEELEEKKTEKAGSGNTKSSSNASANSDAESLRIHESSVKNMVRMATVDNFQGEESDIIIISLVRNGPRGIGFLKDANRINVLLSRAKHGMYLLGNEKALCRSNHSKMWPLVLEILKKNNCFGDSLALRCQNHSETVTRIKRASQFEELVGDGGCSLQCEFKRNCGHKCTRRCHPDDKDHILPCPSKCTRLRDLSVCPFQHLCPKPCGESCGDCTVRIPSVQLACGHSKKNVRCHLAQKPGDIECTELVEIKMPHCGHAIRVECGSKNDFLQSPDLCTAECTTPLPLCGHICRSTCGECLRASYTNGASDQKSVKEFFQNGDRSKLPNRPFPKHVACNSPCDRPLLCAHRCKKKCHRSGREEEKECPPCGEKCSNTCDHGSKCNHLCSEPCGACANPCLWHCPHLGACPDPCGAPCSRLPCDLRCEKKMACGHQCPLVCGEKCPTPAFCQVCGPDNIKDHRVDFVTFATLREHSFSEDGPLVLLGCGHFYTMSSMDEVMGLKSFYTKNENGGGESEKAKAGEKPKPADPAPAPATATAASSTTSSSSTRRSSRLLDMFTGRMSKLEIASANAPTISPTAPPVATSPPSPPVAASSWSEPLKLSQHLLPTKACPDCGLPVTNVKRYGRIIKKSQLDQAQKNFLLITDNLLGKAVAMLSELDDEQALNKKRNRIEEAIDTLKKVLSSQSPALDVYNKVIVLLKSSGGADANHRVDLQYWDVPTPDTSHLCKSYMYMGEAWKRKMQVDVAYFQTILGEDRDIQKLINGAELAAVEKPKAAETFEAIKGFFEKAIKIAASSHSTKTCLEASLRLCHAWKCFLDVLQCFRTHESAQEAKLTYELQMAHVDEAIDRAKAARSVKFSQELSQSGAVSNFNSSSNTQQPHSELLQKLAEVQNDLVAWKTKCDKYLDLSEQEKKDIFRAITEGDSTMQHYGQGGYTGQGHWYTCPNGHVYVIGDCGGAMQESCCPECGAKIGGAQHRLEGSNRQASEFLQSVQRPS